MKKIGLFCLLIITLSACRKNIEEDFSITDHYEPTVYYVDVTASVSGLVMDDNDIPITGALVTMGTRSTMTNDFGLFSFPTGTVNENGTVIRIEKEGFFTGVRRFYPEENSKNYVQSILLRHRVIGSFEAVDGGQLTSSNYIKIDFEPNGIVDANGENYEDQVTVVARWIDPISDEVAEIMPGDLQGLNAGQEAVALTSFGMLQVELLDMDGQALQLGNGKEAGIQIHIPDALVSEAPATIPLWYFDEFKGLWIEEGSADLVDNNYYGKVKHFTAWNCDVPIDPVGFKGRIVDELGAPIANLKVNLIRGQRTFPLGYTRSQGTFRGFAPRGINPTLKVIDRNDCPPLYITQLGEMNADIDLGDITLETAFESYRVVGELLDCNAKSVNDGWVRVSFEDQSRYFRVGPDDANFDISILNCYESEIVNVVGINGANSEMGCPKDFPINSNVVNANNLMACGKPVDQYLRVTLNGEEQIGLADIPYVERDNSPWGPPFTNPPDAKFFYGSYVQSKAYTALTYTTERLSLAGEYFHLLNFVGDGVGTYSEEDLYKSNSLGNYPIRLVMHFDFAQGLMTFNPCYRGYCGLEELVITEYGEVGERITGYYNGLFDFTDEADKIWYELPCKIEFSVIRQY